VTESSLAHSSFDAFEQSTKFMDSIIFLDALNLGKSNHVQAFTSARVSIPISAEGQLVFTGG